jgi:hypothetical protein
MSWTFALILLGLGFVVGKFQLVEVVNHVLEGLPLHLKLRITAFVAIIVCIFVFCILVPLSRVASDEAKRSAAFPREEFTSFRFQLGRRGSF